MISPDILRNSGSAGLFGITMVWAVFVLLPSAPMGTTVSFQSTRADTTETETTWEVERRPTPNRHRIERPSSADGAERAERPTRRQELRDRNRRAQRVIQKLEGTYEATRGAEDATDSSASSSEIDPGDAEEAIEALNQFHGNKDVPLQLGNESDSSEAKVERMKKIIDSLDPSDSSQSGLSADYRLEVGERSRK